MVTLTDRATEGSEGFGGALVLHPFGRHAEAEAVAELTIDRTIAWSQRSSARAVMKARSILSAWTGRRVLLASTDERIGASLEALLDAYDRTTVVALASTPGEAVAAAQAHNPHVAVVDYDLPNFDGIETVRMMRATSPEVQAVLLVGGYDEEDVLTALDAGCSVVLEKARALVELVGAVEETHRRGALLAGEGRGAGGPGGPRATQRPGAGLTDRERDVLACVAEGRLHPPRQRRRPLTQMH